MKISLVYIGFSTAEIEREGNLFATRQAMEILTDAEKQTMHAFGRASVELQ